MNSKEIGRLAVLETKTDGVERRLSRVEVKIDDILENGLPHLHMEIQASVYI